MVGSCWSFFILIQKSYFDFEYNLNFIRNQLKKYIWLRNNFFGKKKSLLIGVKQMEGVKEISPCFFD